ncbi:mandelate racemase/muconate lactonizing enzyme family protein [Robiginitalea sediminis]|uniref:mandelate racemase/muconate lactonizing enzyme family protein n=1 Tax=Robiginitalea sediminis TaxID=1982593 RepID=UPI000B4C02EF|nr:dipeptide epimerase [Robiginitalea sediminis]
MKIHSLEYELLELRLAEPYAIAYETVHSSANIILKVITREGQVGYGCACPDWHVTGERPHEVLRHLEGPVTDLLTGEPAFRRRYYHEQLKTHSGLGPSALAMVDMALLDLMARKAGVPLYQLLGGYRNRMATSITIGILPLDQTLDHAERFLKQGFRILKLKGGAHLEEDIEKVHRLRERFGPGFDLWFDANQGYTAEQAIRFISMTREARIEILEQPTPTADPESLGKVSREVPIPVMADESIKSLADAFHLTSGEMIDMVNIKIQKVGGIQEAGHINSVARAGGLEVMVGCLDECGLGISAGLHFALSRPNIQYADLDGHLDLVDDPFGQLFSLKDGVLIPSDSPGLGPIPTGI